MANPRAVAGGVGPDSFLIYRLIEPTYEASSLLHIEPLAPSFSHSTGEVRAKARLTSKPK